MRIGRIIVQLVLFCFITISTVYALPVSDADLWQHSTITDTSGFNNAAGASPNGLFDGQEGGHGYENGNTLFQDGTGGSLHWVEWQTSGVITLNSINLTAYHDFDHYNINHRGFSDLSLFFHNGSGWENFYSWTFTNPQGDFHYGGGPAHTDTNNGMAESYLELSANVGPITADLFRAEFVQYNSGGGPRVVELDAFSTPVPEPATMLLLGVGLLGIAGVGRRKK